MKREVASAMVEKGVHERGRLIELYSKKRDELERQHNEIRTQLAAEKLKVIIIDRFLDLYLILMCF